MVSHRPPLLALAALLLGLAVGVGAFLTSPGEDAVRAQLKLVPAQAGDVLQFHPNSLADKVTKKAAPKKKAPAPKKKKAPAPKKKTPPKKKPPAPKKPVPKKPTPKPAKKPAPKPKPKKPKATPKPACWKHLYPKPAMLGGAPVDNNAKLQVLRHVTAHGHTFSIEFNKPCLKYKTSRKIVCTQWDLKKTLECWKMSGCYCKDGSPGCHGQYHCAVHNYKCEEWRGRGPARRCTKFSKTPKKITKKTKKDVQTWWKSYHVSCCPLHKRGF